MSTDGTVAPTNWVASEDGKLLVYGLPEPLRLARMARHRYRHRQKPSDHLKWIKFSAYRLTAKAFTTAGNDEPPPTGPTRRPIHHQKLYYTLGDTQDKDTLIYKRRREGMGLRREVTDDFAAT